MTLDELVASLNGASADAREVLSKIKDLLTVNGDIPFNFYDGTTFTTPSLPKLRQQYWDNMNSVMNREHYVDAVSGDDNNDGSAASPFRTLKKAIDSIPTGGYGRIVLTPGQTFEISKHIICYNKLIWLYCYVSDPSQYPVITSPVVESHSLGLAFINRITLCSSSVIVWKCRLVIPDYSGSYTISLHDNALFHAHRFSGFSSFHGYNCIIDLNGDDFSLFSAHSYCDSSAFSVFSLYNPTININNANAFLVSLSMNSLAYTICGSTITLNDNAGSGKGWKDLVSGVIYSSTTGRPLNILSNINFGG